MSLNWNLEAIPNRSEVCWIGEGESATMNPVTHSLIFATMSIGIPEITEANAAEFFVRLQLLDRWQWPNEPQTTYENVKAHIGLKTNAYQSKGRAKGSNDESRAAWLKRIVSYEMDNVKRYL
jgi:hypothetical protein